MTKSKGKDEGHLVKLKCEQSRNWEFFLPALQLYEVIKLQRVALQRL